MATFKVSGRMKVKTLKKHFKDEYGLMLDVKKGKSKSHRAPDGATLAEIRAEKKNGNFSLRANSLVGNIEKKFMSECGVSVNIKYANGRSIPNNVTLGSVKK